MFELNTARTCRIPFCSNVATGHENFCGACSKAVDLINTEHADAVGGVLDYIDHTKQLWDDSPTRRVTPLQLGSSELLDALGEPRGLVRGGTTLVSSAVHNFKTGFLNTLFVQAALFNHPSMFDPTRKPLLVLIHTENEESDTVLWIYKYLKENETGEVVDIDPTTLDDDGYSAIEDYVSNRLTCRGYYVDIRKIDPSTTTAEAFIDKMTLLEASNYEIHGIFFDMPTMLLGPANNNPAKKRRDIIRELRIYSSAIGSALMFTHQLSPQVLSLLRESTSREFVQEVSGKGFHDGCPDLNQEVDTVITIDLDCTNRLPLLNVQVVKKRNQPWDYHDGFIKLPLQPVGGLMWDKPTE